MLFNNTKQNMSDKFLTIEQVAKQLRLSYKTIFRYIHNKRIRASKVGRWRIKQSDVDKFLRDSSNTRS